MKEMLHTCSRAGGLSQGLHLKLSISFRLGERLLPVLFLRSNEFPVCGGLAVGYYLTALSLSLFLLCALRRNSHSICSNLGCDLYSVCFIRRERGRHARHRGSSRPFQPLICKSEIRRSQTSSCHRPQKTKALVCVMCARVCVCL